ncbi:uncharacterized protein LOC119274358 isoform X5 [Triticum dicoccoides]|uniref:uncharacterized protein LOC119274358 isoform X5 n=1 Tax=Triticum dicoccoides TaxID=85692 RepID=UPI00188E8A6D|nr:uncharacterized protein LOC119274358 isoform X5 [Triticum dicoccoides]
MDQKVTSWECATGQNAVSISDECFRAVNSQSSKMSGAAVDKHKTPTEEENRNPAWEDEEDKDQARKEVVIATVTMKKKPSLVCHSRRWVQEMMMMRC